jgi:hypothetical protein
VTKCDRAPVSPYSHHGPNVAFSVGRNWTNFLQLLLQTTEFATWPNAFAIDWQLDVSMAQGLALLPPRLSREIWGYLHYMGGGNANGDRE